MLCQSLVGRPPVEAIEPNPAPEFLELVAQVVDVVGTAEGGFDDLDQPLGEAEGCVLLLKLHEAPGTSAVLRRDGSPAAGANRVVPCRLQGQDLLHSHVVA